MPPERVVDVLALVGDSVDNVPGVPGIGDKGARDLVREYGSLEGVLENADKVKRAAYREGLQQHATTRSCPSSWSRCATTCPYARAGGAAPRRARTARPPTRCSPSWSSWRSPRSTRRSRRPPAPRTIAGTTEEALRAFVARGARRRASSRCRCCARRRAPMRARLVGLGLVAQPRAAPCYVPAASTRRWRCGRCCRWRRVLELLRPLLEDPAVRKLSARGKLDHILLARAGRAAAPASPSTSRGRVPAEPGRRSVSRRGPGPRAPARAPAPDRARSWRAAPRGRLDAAAAGRGAGGGPRPAPGRAAARAPGGGGRRVGVRRRWSCRWSRCWPTWSAPASRSTARSWPR